MDKTDKTAPAGKQWSKPELRRLGTIRDVAGAELPGHQAANGKKS